MILRMHFYADPVLRKKCSIVKEITDEIKEFVANMIETMDAYNGVGLAAPQVGRPIRIFVLRKEKILPDGTFTLGESKVYINPILSDPAETEDVMEEGCLSFPGLRVNVSRPVAINIEAMDLDGNLFREELKDFDARVVMHENDHLNGTFHIDRCSKQERARVQPLIKAIKKKYKHTY